MATEGRKYLKFLWQSNLQKRGNLIHTVSNIWNCVLHILLFWTFFHIKSVPFKLETDCYIQKMPQLILYQQLFQDSPAQTRNISIFMKQDFVIFTRFWPKTWKNQKNVKIFPNENLHISGLGWNIFNFSKTVGQAEVWPTFLCKLRFILSVK